MEEAYPVSLEETLDNFRKNRNPESEIQLWEHMTNVFERELDERLAADIDEQALLFRVILTCSFSANVNDILATLPQAKGLPNLPRVVQRFTERQS